MSAPNDWTQINLSENGRSLIEASAGTGKTWTIGVLYLRLLLERGLSPRRIIVSTFTNAAAAELAERLRARLLWALGEARAFGVAASASPPCRSELARDESRDARDAPDRAWLHARWQADFSQRAVDMQRLHAALAEFDAAPISTLHALCSRILADHPFAAGALFRGREMIDGKTLEKALADDLWRVVSQGDEGDDLVQLARGAKVTRNMLKKYIPVLFQPNVMVAGDFTAEVRAAISGVVGDLATWKSALASVLAQTALLNPRGKLRKAWIALEAALGPDDSELIDAVGAHLETLRDASRMVGVNGPGQAHSGVLQLIEQSAAVAHAVPLLALDMACNCALRHFLAAAHRWCQSAMQARLEAANQSTFDQLLYAVRDALEPRDGQRALADALHAAWPVALVDEFQDTDPVQFGILDAIYRNADRQPRGRLVMIGDPKQAIYRFRGGDVEAYERARAAVPEEDRLTLDTNHRSSRAYVEAVNAFYAATGTRLGPEGSMSPIVYQPVKSSARRDGEPLRDAASGDQVSRPLVIHELPEESADDTLEAMALRACAGQIVRALSEDGYRIGTRALRPGDIAVLLPNHAQIAKLASLLKARGVPCVAVSQASVFDSGTARELRLLLHAAIHPEDPRALRAALVTRLWGGSLARVQALGRDAAAWDAEASRFHRLHELLTAGGPLAVVNQILIQRAAHLLDTVEGERMLTDLRHLGELLQEAWESCGGGERLMAWFADQMQGGAEGADAADSRALRLESDAERVKLMTLHVSKGLEFGVVFLPLMWKHARPQVAKTSAHLLAAPDGKTRHLVEGVAKEQVKQQEFEERFRILYVALTRAIYACHVFALASGVKGSPKDAPLNMLNLAALWPEGSDAQSLVARRSGWECYANAVWHPGGEDSQTRQVRVLPAAPPGPLPRRHSFSSLIGGGRSQLAEEDRPAEDEELVAPDAPSSLDEDGADQSPALLQGATFHAGLDALAAVAGADFGNAVHDLFEHRPPGLPFTAQRESVRAALKAHGVRPREGDLDALVEPLAARLQGVLEARLGGADGPRLIDLSAADMRAEMEFNYRLDGTSLRELRRACEAHGERDLVPRREQTLAGLMNGKIDLIFSHDGRFHVLDYKGNDLSQGTRPRLEHYAPEPLEVAMHHANYRFQALLYAVALERYLRERLGAGYLRAQHLGDAWYLFIRATGLSLPDGTPCGVWRHRFDDALLDAVQSVLGADLREAA